MICPECKERLLIVECGNVELDMCLQGHGLWFDADELRQLFELVQVPQRLRELESELQELRSHPGRKRRCCRCRVWMQFVETPGGSGRVILDRCPDGHGLWFDKGELEAVLAAELSDDQDALSAVRRHLGMFLGTATKDGD